MDEKIRNLAEIFFPEALQNPKDIKDMMQDWKDNYKEDMTWIQYKEMVKK